MCMHKIQTTVQVTSFDNLFMALVVKKAIFLNHSGVKTAKGLKKAYHGVKKGTSLGLERHINGLERRLRVFERAYERG